MSHWGREPGLEKDTSEDLSQEELHKGMNRARESRGREEPETSSSSQTADTKDLEDTVGRRPGQRRWEESDTRGIALSKAESREIYRRPSELDQNLSESSPRDSEELEGNYSETSQRRLGDPWSTDSRQLKYSGSAKKEGE